MTQASTVLTDISCPNLTPFKSGKVRNLFDLGDHLLIVASDRVSAFDYVLPEGIPEKGKVLTRVSRYWFDKISDKFNHHLISTDVNDFPEECQPYRSILEGRSMLVKKTKLIEIECVVRGYIVGSGWKEYQESGTVCGLPLPNGLQQADKLDEPIFTPAFKASDGHDENISFERMVELIGQDLAETLRDKSIELYLYGRDVAESKGIILADTKFEFGTIDDDIVLIDEVLTPDSSRYWPKDAYRPGISPPSFDKQIVRDYLEESGWDKTPPIPHLPESVIEKASKKYLELERLLYN